MLPFSFDNVTAALCIWQRSGERGIWDFFWWEGEIYIWGICFESFSNHLEYQVWKNVACPDLISGLGTGRRKMEEKIS